MHDRAIEALPPRFGQIVVLLAEYEERGLDFRAPSQHRYEVGDIGRLGPQGRQIQADSQRPRRRDEWIQRPMLAMWCTDIPHEAMLRRVVGQYQPLSVGHAESLSRHGSPALHLFR